MQNLVLKSEEGELFTTSLIISELFDRPHKNVLQSLDKLVDKLGIKPSSYINSQNKKQRMFVLDERQALIAMPFIGGEKSVDGQIKLVDAFIAMRKALTKMQTKNFNLQWQEARKAAAIEYKVMSATLKEARRIQGKETKGYHYMTEAKLINYAMTKKFDGIDREKLSNADLDIMNLLETRNAVLLGLGIEYKERKKLLSELYDNVTTNKLSN